jgi:hypothetical protein
MESHRSSRLSGFAFGGLEADTGSAGALAEVDQSVCVGFREQRGGFFTESLGRPVAGTKRRVKTPLASSLIISITFPSSSIFALSVGAGKLTRATQPSPPSAVQRMPPPPVAASSLSRLRASATSFRCEFFQPVGLFVDFAIFVPALARHEWHGQEKKTVMRSPELAARELDGLRREIVVACNARSVLLRPAIIKQRNNLPACGHHRD